MSKDGRFYELQDRDQERMLYPSLRQLVADDEDVLAFDAVVEQLDFTALEGRYQSVGHPAYPPQVMFSVLVYGYSIGLRSSRQIARACRRDDGFRFLAHGLQPDFRTVCRFRRRFAAELEELFVQTVRLCHEVGLVWLGHVAVDGTKVRANRSAERLAKAREAFAQALREAEAADGEDGAEEGEAEWDAEECQFMKTPDGIKPAYNAQVAVDSVHQVIVAQGVVTEETDRGQLPEMVNQVKANCGRRPGAVSADGGYYTEATVKELKRQKVRGYLPVPKRGGPQFEWVAEEEAYRCPAGHWLRGGRVRDGKRIYRTQRCGGCEHAGECGVRRRTKELHIPLAESAVGELERRMKGRLGRAVYAARKQIVEPVLGKLKHNWGFRRFGLRGQVGAGAEWSLLCAAHNLKKCARVWSARRPVVCAAVVEDALGRVGLPGQGWVTDVGRRVMCAAYRYFVPPIPVVVPAVPSEV